MTADHSAPTIVLGISGSIAAYKSVEVARLLLKQGARVLPMMTAAATRFVGEATLGGICGRAPISSMWGANGEPHVELASAADVVALVPATANLLADMAHGRAGDVVRATVLCAQCPVVIAPAMHPSMWSHPATRRNVTQLAQFGRFSLVGPVDGPVASGDSGVGRMADPETIAAAILHACGEQDLSGRRLLISAGPTVEDLDPARYLSNRSSGKMGFSVAARAAARGASVTLIAGPVALPTPPGVSRVDVRSAREMQRALDDQLGESLQGADALIMAAAVADYRPQQQRVSKLKRKQDTLTLEFVKNDDLLAAIGARRQMARPLLIGFALETVPASELAEVARGKLQRKGVDLVVANRAADSFDRDDNIAMLVSAGDDVALPKMSKLALADKILDRVASMFSNADRHKDAGRPKDAGEYAGG